MNKNMSRIGLLFAAAFAVASANAIEIAVWDFNGTSMTTVPGGTASPTASVGIGTASLIGGVSATFASGTASGGSSDPVTTTPNNYGWNTTTYAAQGLENGARGVQFAVSTVGYSDITVEFDLRHSNTSSRFVRVDYSTDGGGSWTNGIVFDHNAGDTWFNNQSVDLSGVLAANENATFVFRIVAVFDASSGQYAASNSSNTYAGSGTLRYDMVQVMGNVVPEPASILALGIGAAILFARRRR